MSGGTTRRQLLLGIGSVLAAAPVSSLAALLPTPSGPTGPFYPRQPPADDDNDLTRVRGRTERARGEFTELTGRLLDRNGGAISGGRIEIWQCDFNARYHHPRDWGRELDPNFQGFGHTVTDAEGRYRFTTIKPVHYPGRTPHIHMAVWVPGRRAFVTQLYVRDEPRNAEDSIFQRVPVERRDLVLASFLPASRSDLNFTAAFDVVLDITPTSA